MPFFTRKPLKVEAVLCSEVVSEFNKYRISREGVINIPEWLLSGYQKGLIRPTFDGIYISTPRGDMFQHLPVFAALEDWIVLGPRGRVYPVKPSDFASEHDPVPVSDSRVRETLTPQVLSEDEANRFIALVQRARPNVEPLELEEWQG